MKTFLRILIIGAILLILVFLSIGIVRIVPKAVSSLASASVSISSLFQGKSATSTNATDSTQNGSVSNDQNNAFIVSSSTSNNGANGTSTTNGANGTSTNRSLKDILFPNANNFPPNNYVPTPGTNTSHVDNRGAYSSKQTGVYHSTPVCTAGGSSDLAVTIIGKGAIDPSTGRYIETNNFTTSDNVSIKFKVENRGTCPTGTWSFHAQLPSSNSVDQSRDVTSVASLPAGSAVTGVANFDAPQAGNTSAVFTVTDSSGRDGNTSNNTASINLYVTNNGSVINNTNNGSVGTTGDGRPDLLIHIIQTGVLDYNNNFIPTASTAFRSTDRVAVQFQVINQGRSATGAWNFQATLTNNNGGYPKNYNNPQYEASIPAGGSSLYTMAFDNVGYGNDTINIFVDNMNQVNEFNEGNNTASVTFFAN